MGPIEPSTATLNTLTLSFGLLVHEEPTNPDPNPNINNHSKTLEQRVKLIFSVRHISVLVSLKGPHIVK